MTRCRFAVAFVSGAFGLALAACSSEAVVVIPSGQAQDSAGMASTVKQDPAPQDASSKPATAEVEGRKIPRADPPPPVDVIGVQDSVGLQWVGSIYHKDRMRWKAPDPVEDYFVVVVREQTAHFKDLGVEAGKAYRYRGGNQYEYIRDVDLSLDNTAIAGLFGAFDDKPIDLLIQAAEADDAAGVRKALAGGLSPDSCNRSERPVLLVAARTGSLNAVRVLIEAGAPHDLSDVSGETALHQAARGGHVDVVSYLIEQGADVKHEDRLGHGALFFGAEGNAPDVVKLLIDNGADVSAKDERGYTALAYAKVFLRSRIKPELKELLTPKD